MAPEVLKGQKYGSKADVWSLGCLLYNILTREHPFTANEMDELKRNVENGKFAIPPGLGLSLHCLGFLTCCLKFDSKERKDWAELIDHDWFLKTGPTLYASSGQTLELDARQSTDLMKVILQQHQRDYKAG